MRVAWVSPHGGPRAERHRGRLKVRRPAIDLARWRGSTKWCPAHSTPARTAAVEKTGLFGPKLTALVAFMKGVCHASFSAIRKFLLDVKFLTTLPDKKQRAYGKRVREALCHRTVVSCDSKKRPNRHKKAKGQRTTVKANLAFASSPARFRIRRPTLLIKARPFPARSQAGVLPRTQSSGSQSGGTS